MEKKKNKTLVKVIIFIIVAALLVLSGFILVKKTELGRHVFGTVYPGSHMKCDVNITVDGTLYSVDKESVTGLKMNNGKINKVSGFKQKESGCRFRCKGGQYGNQPFEITIQTADMKEPCVIPVQVVVPDSWEFTDVTLSITVDTKSEKYSYDASMEIGGHTSAQSDETTFDDMNGIHISGV